jgi:hypothetical protein
MLAPGTDVAFSSHVSRQTVVLPDLRVLFLPVPKAGCTSVLWRLAELAGLPEERFEQSTLPEPSAALTVHDLNVWDHGHRLAHHPPSSRERIFGDDGWLRFTLVRDPWRRLWSGWQSKLLLREPRFVGEFGDRPWFPRLPARPEELVEDFRRFVLAVGEGDAEDVHWAVQHELVSQLPIDHVGRVERMGETIARLEAHVGGDRRRPRPAAHANTSAVPMPAHAYDEATAEIVRDRYRADFEAYGYDDEPPPVLQPPEEWERDVAPLLGLMRTAIDAHARVGQLQRLAQRRAARVRELESRVERLAVRRSGPGAADVFTNLEGHDAFSGQWSWEEEPAPGFTAVVRVRDEARTLPWSLPPLLRAAERVVLLDNGSTDGTPAVARRVAEAAGAGDRLELHDYPFAVARCGDDHLGTPAESAHSLAYFYNWSFAHVRTAYALKWDGDMVLTDAAVAVLRDLAWQLQTGETIVRVPRVSVYVADERSAFVDTELRNCEPWAWPNLPGYRFVKALEWELPMFPDGVSAITLPDHGCAEIKFLDADEFAHWSPTDFTASPRTARKLRERQVFDALVTGARPPRGVERVDAPPGRHVIEHLRTSWFPARALAAGGARARP